MWGIIFNNSNQRRRKVIRPIPNPTEVQIKMATPALLCRWLDETELSPAQAALILMKLKNTPEFNQLDLVWKYLLVEDGMVVYTAIAAAVAAWKTGGANQRKLVQQVLREGILQSYTKDATVLLRTIIMTSMQNELREV